MTNSLIEEMMMASLRSPLDLCDRLGLRPTQYQGELLDQFYHGTEPLEVTDVPAQNTVNVAAVCALWRLLLIPGSKCVVIAASRDLQSRFMGFLHDLTTKIDPALSSVCRWSSNKTMKIGDAAGYELRFMSNNPAWAQGIHDEALTVVILGARSSEPRFNETREVLELLRGRDGTRFIVLW